MRIRTLLLVFIAAASASAQLKSGPPLPHKVVENWAQLPKGWNLGETSGVDVDKDDNVWVFNRGPHPVIQFDRNGKMLQAWTEVPVNSSHGIRVGPDGSIWAADVKGHTLFQFSPAGRILKVWGNAGRAPGAPDQKDAFNQLTGVSFSPDGKFVYVSDGYVNSRILKLTTDGDYVTQWGRKGKGDGEFDIVHDVAVDKAGRVYVADRTNNRVQIFDGDGKFLTKWTDLGSPWGLYYVERENAMYMVDGFANRLLKLNLEGQILGVLGSYGKTPGKFDFVHNVAVDSQGNIYVAEIKNWRVQKFAK